MKYTFTGFTSETIRFFKDLEINNNKEWFDANRKIYEINVRGKMKELCEALAPAMKNIDMDFDLRSQRCISRINRDIRFSKDKSPYKTHLWLAFMHPVKSEEWVSYPGFFLEFNAHAYTIGMGMYQPKKTVMDDIRDHIGYLSEEFKLETEKLLANGYKIGGEEYKRTIKNNLPEYFQPWYNRKGIFVSKQSLIGDEIFSSKFQEILETEFLSLEWFYNFLKQSQPE